MNDANPETATPDIASPASAAAPAEARDPVRRGLVFGIVALALIMMSINSTIVATALHALQLGLNTSVNWAGWTITAYAVGFVLMLPISGKLSERYGHYKVFLASIIAFTVASLLCGLVDDIYLLIALRALQAVGGAGFTPSATGIIVNHFGDQRDRAVGLFGSIFPIGSMLGPIFGGLFVEYWSWRGIFFVNVPLGILVAFLVMRYVPRDQPEGTQERARMDLVGIALLGVGLLAGMLTTSYLAETSVHTLSFVLPLGIVVSIGALWLFFRHVNRTDEPAIPPRLIYGSGFGQVNFVNLLYGGLTSGSIALAPLYAINRYHMSALNSGTLLIAQGLAAILFSVAAAFALRRTGYRPPLYVGGSIIALGIVLLALKPMFGISPYAWLAGSAFLIGVGSGTINPATRNAGLQLAPERSSTLAALRSMFMATGAIGTISVATALLAASSDPGGAQVGIYVATAVLLIAALPVITRVPEHRGAW
jgi:EmrB/QacA subfamily drug resistance transporter